MKDDVRLYNNIQILLEYIEDHLKEPMTLDDFSSVANLSKFHLIRVFRNFTDLTLMNYVQSRRLAQSLHLLLTTNMRVVDIALDYNFEHEQSYIRAFKKYFNLTPGQYRKNQIPVSVVNPISIERCFPIKEGVVFPTFVVKPSFYLEGIPVKIVGNENMLENTAKNKGHDFFFNHSQKIINPLDAKVYYGLTWHENNSYTYAYYMPSLETMDLNKTPEDMTGIQVLPHKYATFKYIGKHSAVDVTFNHLLDLHNYIHDIWMPKNNYNLFDEGSFFFERIDMNISSEHYCEVELYYPLKLE